MIFSFLLRFIFLKTWREPFFDEAWVISKIRELKNNPEYFWRSTNQPPLTIFIYFIWSEIFGLTYISLRNLAALFGVFFGLIIIIYLYKKNPNKKLEIGILAVALVLDWTINYRFKTGDINSIAIYIGLISYIIMLEGIQQNTYSAHFFVGALFGVAMLAKFTLIFLIFPYILIFLYKIIPKKKYDINKGKSYYLMNLKRTLLKAIIAFLAFLLIFLPYLIFIIINGNFENTFLYHSAKLSFNTISYLKSFFKYSQIIAIFSIVSLLQIFKKYKKIEFLYLLLTLTCLIWLFTVPYYIDFSYIQCFIPFLAFEGIIFIGDIIKSNFIFINLNSQKTSCFKYKKDQQDYHLIYNGMVEKYYSLLNKQNVIIKKYFSIFVSILFFSAAIYPIYSQANLFYNNTNEIHNSTINAANFLNDLLLKNNLTENGYVVAPLPVAVLLIVKNYKTQHETCVLSDFYEKELIKKLNYFCMDYNFRYIRKTSINESILFKIAYDNRSVIIDNFLYELVLLSQFDHLLVFEVTKQLFWMNNSYVHNIFKENYNY